MKKEKGITLIALIVTIIVLLILAGVSLRLIAGSNGIIGKAEKGINEYEKAILKEDIEMTISELAVEYYENITQKTSPSFFQYCQSLLENGIITEQNAELVKNEDNEVIYINTKGEQFYVEIDNQGNVQEIKKLGKEETIIRYTISYDANGGKNPPKSQKKKEDVTLKLSSVIPTREGYIFLGWDMESSAKEPSYKPESEFNLNTDQLLYAVWKKIDLGVSVVQPQNYGDVVKYEANGIEDWKIFYNDGTYIYLIISGYLPIEKIPKELNAKGEGQYVVNWRNDPPDFQLGWKEYKDSFLASKFNLDSHSDEFSVKCVSALLNTNNWTAFGNGKSGSNRIENGVAIGSPTLRMFIESWNQKGYKKLNPIVDDEQRECFEENGEFRYFKSLSNENYDGCDDVLYFPFDHHATPSYVGPYGYRLSNIAGEGFGATYTIMSSNGQKAISTLGTLFSYESVWGEGISLRPVVRLPLGIKMVEIENVWTLYQ